MKVWPLRFTGILFVAFLVPAGGSVESPVTRNPASYGTIPQSSFRSGLVNTPNPIDPTGNLLITGNVRRGMHFRGSVPYRSTTSFRATLGSSALDSFLRDAVGSEDFGSAADKYRVQPFYSPTQTVTTMVPGRSEVFSPMGVRIDDRVRQGTPFVGDGLLGLEASPRGQPSPDQDAGAGGSDFQGLQRRYHLLTEPASTSEGATTLSLSSQHAELLVPGQLGLRRRPKRSPQQERDGLAERSQDRIQDDGGHAPAPFPSSARRPDSRRQTRGQEGSKGANRGGRQEENAVTDAPQVSESVFVDLQRRQNTPARDDLTHYPGEQVSLVTGEASLVSREDNNERRETRPIPGVRPLESEDRREVLEEIRRQLEALSKSVEAGLQEEAGSIPDPQNSMLDERDSDIKTPASLDFQLGPNDENLESFSQSRFNLHVRAAEEHLKAGRFYRAVDSFTLASVYQPNNPVVLAGRGHALFAAREYMSSALFLARALAIEPDGTQTKVDLAAMLGGAEKLAARIADVEQWLARSGSVQLQFLLGYVYFRTGRLNQANQAIAAAYEKMPDSPAVVALKTAIHQATK